MELRTTKTSLISGNKGYFPKGERLRPSRTSFAEIHDSDIPLPHLQYADASSISSVVTLTNTTVGGGVLGLPYAVSSCGFVLGGCLLVGSAALTVFSCHLLIHCATKISYPKSFYHVAEASVPQLTFLIDVALVLLCFGVGASYLIMIGGLMPDVMDQMGVSGVWNDRSTWIIIGSILPYHTIPHMLLWHNLLMKKTSQMVCILWLFLNIQSNLSSSNPIIHLYDVNNRLLHCSTTQQFEETRCSQMDLRYFHPIRVLHRCSSFFLCTGLACFGSLQE
jgi:hypothetical protein